MVRVPIDRFFTVSCVMLIMLPADGGGDDGGDGGGKLIFPSSISHPDDVHLLLSLYSLSRLIYLHYHYPPPFADTFSSASTLQLIIRTGFGGDDGGGGKFSLFHTV